MPKVSLDGFRSWAKRTVITLAATIVLGAAAIAWILGDRPSLADVDWTSPAITEAADDSVTVTWFGVTTLLFDDGETQILIDGFFSRPSLADIVFDVPVQSSAAQINYVLDEYRMRRLAAIIPVHSHFDHAMDVGALANRSSASILGSATTAQVARGAGVPDDQILIATSGSEYAFGKFRITLIDSVHAPLGWGGSVPYDGTIDTPLETPAPVSAWREGKSYTIVVAHEQGTTIVQGSAGFLVGALDDVQADVVMLGAFGLDGLGRNYTEQYWQALVTTTGAQRVFPIHFDDYTRPFGEVILSPRLLDNFVDTAGWLEEIRDLWDTDTHLHVPEFGQPIVLYLKAAPEA